MNKPVWPVLPKHRLQLREVNFTIGTPELCAWLVAPGDVRLQTRHPDHYQRLIRRSDVVLAGSGMNCYLKIVAVKKGLAWAERLIGRYIKATPAGGSKANIATKAAQNSSTKAKAANQPLPLDLGLALS